VAAFGAWLYGRLHQGEVEPLPNLAAVYLIIVLVMFMSAVAMYVVS
jgi:hypothetical protein